MNDLLLVLLQKKPEGGFDMSFLIFFGLIIVVFYFFMIRPQMKKQKDLKNFRESLKNGDKIVTVGGVYGKIIEVRDEAIVIEVEDQTRIKIHKSAVVKDPADLQQGRK